MPNMPQFRLTAVTTALLALAAGIDRSATLPVGTDAV